MKVLIDSKNKKTFVLPLCAVLLACTLTGCLGSSDKSSHYGSNPQDFSVPQNPGVPDADAAPGGSGNQNGQNSSDNNNSDSNASGKKGNSQDGSSNKIYKNSLQIDGIYRCKTKLNQQNAQKDGKAVDVLVFARIKPSFKESVSLQASTENASVVGNILNLKLSVSNGKEKKEYVTQYEYNDRKNKLTRNWRFYKSGTYIHRNIIANARNNKCNRIVGLFSIPDAEYKKLVKDSSKLTLLWDRLTAEIKGKKIVTKNDAKEIGTDLKKQRASAIKNNKAKEAGSSKKKSKSKK